MTSLSDMKKSLIPEYQEKFNKLESIAFKLHKMEIHDIEQQVFKKMAGLKMLIDHCQNA